MKKLIILVLTTLISGCASIQSTKTSSLVETLNYPYKKVFYACESAVTYIPNWRLENSKIDEGYLYFHQHHNIGTAIVLVEEINEYTTLVKVSKEAQYTFYRPFMGNLKRILNQGAY